MNNVHIKQLGDSIGYLSIVDKKGIVDLLNNYGANLNLNSTVSSVTDSVLSNVSDIQFFNMFKELVRANMPVVNPEPEYKGATGSSSGFFSGLNLAGLLNTGAGVFGAISQSKAQRDLLKAQANQQANDTAAAIAQQQLILEQEKLKLAQIQASKQSGASNGGNTLLYVGVGFGAILLIAVLALVIKKK